MIQAAPLSSFLVVFGRKSQFFPFKKLGASIAVFRQKTSVDQRLARYRPMRLRHGCRHPAVIFGFLGLARGAGTYLLENHGISSGFSHENHVILCDI